MRKAAVKEIAKTNVEKVKYAMQNRGSKTPVWVLDTFVDEMIAQVLDRYSKAEIVNFMRSGNLIEMRGILVDELLKDDNIRWMVKASTKDVVCS